MLTRPILYGSDISPAVRTVLLTAKFIGLEFDYRNVDLLKREQFLEINPQHTVPTLVDAGDRLWESAAICTYLIGKYGPPDGCSLYPSDPLQRARIDQHLHFNNGILFPLVRTRTVRALGMGRPALKPGLLKSAIEAVELFEAIQRAPPSGDFLVGDQLTMADVATATTFSFLEKCFPLPELRFARTAAWMKRVEAEIPFYAELNGVHVEEFGRMFAAKCLQNTE